MSIASSMSSLLSLAKDFTIHANEAMSRRDEVLDELKLLISSVIVNQLGITSEQIAVKSGGRQSNYSPIPFVRIFDPLRAKSAQDGFYLALLFAADGSAVYLTLQHGTSEMRSGSMRPLRDATNIGVRSSQARLMLGAWDCRVFRDGTTAIDLNVDSASVGVESRQRARNYEFANVLAYRYAATSLPSDAQFTQDLEELLLLLFDLYGVVLPQDVPAQGSVDPATEKVERPRSFGFRQGRRLDPDARKAIEGHAVAMAIAHYEGLGWHVTVLGKPYDLKCLRGDEELHVEVKGTVTRGEEIILTPNEVDHARACRTSLFVVSGITLADANVTSGGEAYIEEPWQIEDIRLTPSQYAYRVVR